ncbi:MAG: TAXI family TRAP transporter solute-binding subunit [Bradyrhizobium sp.]|nr:TAXI family TRAP transporter solute-binding subunit [Bradyrhizobium sp.]
MSVPDGLTGAGELALRSRKIKRSPFLVLAAGLLLVGAIVSAFLLIMRPTALKIAVGPAGSSDLNLIQALARKFAQDQSPVRLVVIPTAGPVDSIAALRAHRVDLAVARSDEEMPDGTESVAILRKNVVVLWTPSRKGSKKGAKSKIKGIGDLAGRRIAVVGKAQIDIKLLRVILAESGVDPDKVTVAQFGTDQVAEMLHDTAIDAFMTVGPADSKITAEAIAATARARGEPAFLPIDVSEAIATRHPLYESEEIPASSFSSSPARPDDTVETVGINHLMVAPKSLSETTVGALTRQLFAARPSLARELPSAAKITKPDTDKDAALPAHPGAAAYIDGNERTFMDNYSDYIWGAVLLVSVLGSGAAGLRHYVKRDERRLYVLHREKLLAAIALVRQINSIDELDAMQREADDFLRETLESYDDGAIEPSDLAAYGLVLEQFHNAVVDRRTAIGASTGNLPRMRVGQSTIKPG